MGILPDTAERSPAGHLCLGGCDVVELAEQFGTPLYIYDKETLISAAKRYIAALTAWYPATFTVAYASKAYLCVELARQWAALGLGLDVVGPGEFEIARRAGVPAGRIHLHGNNKPPALLARAVEAGVGRVVIDGWHDFDRIEGLQPAEPVPVWLRLSPGIDVHTHRYRKTGLVDSKFGFPIVTGDAERAVARALASPHVDPRGLHAHIGSQIFEAQPFVDCAAALVDFAAQMGERHGWQPAELSPGGGWGVPYTPDQPDLPPETYLEPLCRAVATGCRARGLALPHLVVEPGRSLVARAGVAIYAVGGRKEIPGGRVYLSLDGGLADNPRPALYGAQYAPLCANREGGPRQGVTLCGPFCESGDVLGDEVLLPALRPGDLVAVPVAGAYQLAMASAYNGFPRPAALLVADGQARLMQRRETVADLLARDIL